MQICGTFLIYEMHRGNVCPVVSGRLDNHLELTNHYRITVAICGIYCTLPDAKHYSNLHAVLAGSSATVLLGCGNKDRKF